VSAIHGKLRTNVVSRFWSIRRRLSRGTLAGESRLTKTRSSGPPQATPNHRQSDTAPIKRPRRGRSAVKPDRVKWRRIVKVNTSASSSDVIFTQNGKL
jgi:hypothetical protein